MVAAVVVYAPPFQELLGTASIPLEDLLLLLPFPFIVWGADELRRWLLRRHDAPGAPTRAALADAPSQAH